MNMYKFFYNSNTQLIDWYKGCIYILGRLLFHVFDHTVIDLLKEGNETHYTGETTSIDVLFLY